MSSEQGKVKIGLEVHVGLKTNSKLFCSCKLPEHIDAPNTHTCPICLGYPGARPVLNKAALDAAIKLCLALDCKISSSLIFSRKTYFYPDLAKNFQITQYEEPLGKGGAVKLMQREIELTRIHIEEDPASIIYPQGAEDSTYVHIDYNRSGTPLVEIVTEPVMTSPKEAREFMNRLLTVVQYLDIVAQEVVMKADVNVSIEESGYQRVEIKNVTGFKDVEKALNYEIARQRMCVRHRRPIVLETRGWNGRATVSQRLKETEADYGYIIEPDLPTLEIDEALIQSLEDQMTELAPQKAKRYFSDFGIDERTADVLASELALAELYEQIAKEADPVLSAKWLRGELLRVLNYNKKTLAQVDITAKHLIDLILLVQTKEIAETTNESINTVISHMHYAVKKIKNQIEKEYEPRRKTVVSKF